MKASGKENNETEVLREVSDMTYLVSGDGITGLVSTCLRSEIGSDVSV